MKKILLPALAALFAAACSTVHEFPEDGGTDPTLIDVVLDLSIDMDYYGEISRNSYAEYASMLEGDFDIRYIVEIYKAGGNPGAEPNQQVARIVRTSGTVTEGTVNIVETLRIPAMDYVILAWVDFVNKSEEKDLYYDTEKLTEVSIIKPGGVYKGYNTTRDAFCGNVEMNLTQFRGQLSVEYHAVCPVLRPFAVYKIITTDVEKYFTRNEAATSSGLINPSITNLRYRYEFPVSYNTLSEEPCQYETNMGYGFEIADIEDENEVLIASDYVLVYPDDIIYVDFDVRDADNELINTIEDLQIKLKRNMITIIRGEFLTVDYNGGIGIDDRFDGEIVIQL